MAKNSWNDYSATASSNTDVGSIDISEGCSPANINDAIREVMSHTADVVAGTTALTSLSITTGVFGDGTSSAPSLTNSGDTDTGIYFSGANEVSLATGGTQRLSVNSSGHLNHNGSASADINALTSSTAITIDMSTAQNHSVTLAHNTTFDISNGTAGQTGSILITQDSSGSKTASFSSKFKFAGATAPTLSTTASAVDRIDYFIVSSSLIHAVATLNLS
tara:strand:- start:1617 stop:2276 length:660 start_codon:yes stop_codon:yes gene_type:complete